MRQPEKQAGKRGQVMKEQFLIGGFIIWERKNQMAKP